MEGESPHGYAVRNVADQVGDSKEHLARPKMNSYSGLQCGPVDGRETLSFGADDQKCACFRARFTGGYAAVTEICCCTCSKPAILPKAHPASACDRMIPSFAAALLAAILCL
jgi:hypothetical protein